MSVAKAITVRLDPQDYDRLETEASKLGVRPGTLARVYIRTALGMKERNRDRGLEALDRLAELRAELPAGPALDAVKIVREGREELDRRLTS